MQCACTTRFWKCRHPVRSGQKIGKPNISEVFESSIDKLLDSLHVQSVLITTKVVSSNPVHGEVNLIQHYVIKFVSELRQVGGFLRLLPFPPPIKLTATI